MKKLGIYLIVVSALLAIAPSQAFAWYCSARGTTGAYGWGKAYYV
jgi:hypothetical protein